MPCTRPTWLQSLESHMVLQAQPGVTLSTAGCGPKGEIFPCVRGRFFFPVWGIPDIMRAFVPRPVRREWWVLAMNGASSLLTGHGKHSTVNWAMWHSTLVCYKENMETLRRRSVQRVLFTVPHRLRLSQKNIPRLPYLHKQFSLHTTGRASTTNSQL